MTMPQQQTDTAFLQVMVDDILDYFEIMYSDVSGFNGDRMTQVA